MAACNRRNEFSVLLLLHQSDKILTHCLIRGMRGARFLHGKVYYLPNRLGELPGGASLDCCFGGDGRSGSGLGRDLGASCVGAESITDRLLRRLVARASRKTSKRLAALAHAASLCS